jgi:hypothetical protein
MYSSDHTKAEGLQAIPTLHMTVRVMCTQTAAMMKSKCDVYGRQTGGSQNITGGEAPSNISIASVQSSHRLKTGDERNFHTAMNNGGINVEVFDVFLLLM